MDTCSVLWQRVIVMRALQCRKNLLDFDMCAIPCGECNRSGRGVEGLVRDSATDPGYFKCYNRENGVV
jgi:hypothetical protein